MHFRSDGAQPHLVNIQFQKKVKLQLVVLYVDFKLDESYTPSKVSIRAGDGFHNLKVIVNWMLYTSVLLWVTSLYMYIYCRFINNAKDCSSSCLMYPIKFSGDKNSGAC